METAIATYRLKLESLLDILNHWVNKMILGRRKANEIKYYKKPIQLRKKYLKNGIWDFNGIRLPHYIPDTLGIHMYYIYLDSFFVYCMHNDNYESSLVDLLENFIPEGTYCYKNKEIDITIKKNDIVIDAGAWIGDFSAYAAVKGAIVYAFEPCQNTVKYLKKTQELNKNIHVVEKGLGNIPGQYFLSNDIENSGQNKITNKSFNTEKIELTTLDSFISDNQIEKVDFLKSDIEGFERYMLLGAKETLKRFGPKLAICTYHLPDDPVVIAKIILDANPNYVIVQKRKKLYAMVKQ